MSSNVLALIAGCHNRGTSHIIPGTASIWSGFRRTRLISSLHERTRLRKPSSFTRFISTSPGFTERIRKLWSGPAQPSEPKTWSTPLQDPSRQIRLLRLPEDLGEHDEVKVTMQTYNLDEMPVYRAISYSCGSPFETYDDRFSAWVQPSNDPKVVCNNEVVDVGQNLLEGLQAIILKYPGALLWVDALCIDQHNDAEKLKQIFLMDTIYEKADEVIVWLGRDTTTQDWAITKLAYLTHVYDLFGHGEKFWSEDAQANREQWSRLSGLPQTELDVLFGQAICSIMGLLERTWWKRMWTFQEAVLANKIVYLCESSVFSPGQLQRLVEHLLIPRMLLPEFHDMLVGMIQKVGQLDWSDIRESLSFPKKTTTDRARINEDLDIMRQVISGLSEDSRSFAIVLLLFVILTRRRVATEPRDKILSLMGVTKAIAGRFGDNFESDFTVSERDIYRFWNEAAKYALLRDPTLEVFRYATKYVDDGRQRPPLPSWAPAFERLDFNARLRVTGDWACGDWDPSFHGLSRQFSTSLGLGFPTFLALGNEAFGLRGIRIGDVHSISQVPGIPLKWWNGRGKVIDAKYDSLRAMLHFCQHIPTRYYYHSDASLQSGLWRVLVFNVSSCEQKEFEKWAGCTFTISFLRRKQNGESDPDPELIKRFTIFKNAYTYIPRLTVTRDDERSIDHWINELLWQQQESGISLPKFPYRLFCIGKDKIGSTAMAVREGDQVWILQGVRHPFVLRPTWIPGYFRLVGEAYVDGVMKGEILQERGANPGWKVIWLV